jgi:chromosome segregation ATPase
MALKDSNRFRALRDEDPEDPYEEFEDIAPYKWILDGCKWRSLSWQHSSHPIVSVLRETHDTYSDRRLTSMEMYFLKEKLDEAKARVTKCEQNKKMHDLYYDINKQKSLCSQSSKCAEDLQAHLKVCSETEQKYKCREDFVAYFCQFKDNGRCEHYYEIEHLEEEVGWYEQDLSETRSSYYSLETHYERAKAIRENFLAEYEKKKDEEWDDMCFEAAMNMNMIQMNKKQKKF